MAKLDAMEGMVTRLEEKLDRVGREEGEEEYEEGARSPMLGRENWAMGPGGNLFGGSRRGSNLFRRGVSFNPQVSFGEALRKYISLDVCFVALGMGISQGR